MADQRVTMQTELHESLPMDMKTLLDRGLFADVTLLVQGVELKAHRAILAARNTYFASMFGSGMSESTSDKPVVLDVPVESFRIFLCHLYTGDASEINSTNARGVLLISEYFAADHLRDMCIRVLLERPLQPDVALELLSDAHLRLHQSASWNMLFHRAVDSIGVNLLTLLRSNADALLALDRTLLTLVFLACPIFTLSDQKGDTPGAVDTAVQFLLQYFGVEDDNVAELLEGVTALDIDALISSVAPCVFDWTVPRVATLSPGRKLISPQFSIAGRHWTCFLQRDAQTNPAGGDVSVGFTHMGLADFLSINMSSSILPTDDVRQGFWLDARSRNVNLCGIVYTSLAFKNLAFIDAASLPSVSAAVSTSPHFLAGLSPSNATPGGLRVRTKIFVNPFVPLCLSYMAQHFLSRPILSQLPRLTVTYLKALVAFNGLNVSSEVPVIRAVASWLKSRSSPLPTGPLESLIDCLRLSSLPLVELLEAAGDPSQEPLRQVPSFLRNVEEVVRDKINDSSRTRRRLGDNDPLYWFSRERTQRLPSEPAEKQLVVWAIRMGTLAHTSISSSSESLQPDIQLPLHEKDGPYQTPPTSPVNGKLELQLTLPSDPSPLDSAPAEGSLDPQSGRSFGSYASAEPAEREDIDS